AATLDVACERDPGCLDLARGQPAAVDRLQAEVAEGEPRATPRRPLAAALHHLPPFDFLRLQHGSLERSAADGGALLLLLLGQHLAAEDPDLDADDTVGRVRLRETVRDLGPERVQRHPSLAVPLAARDLGATEATRRLDTDPERSHPHG